MENKSSKRKEKLDETHFLYQYTDGFSFGTDAVLLAGFIRTKKSSVCVEFGTGTGIIPILLSMHKQFSHIFAFEIQKDYALLAEENFRLNKIEDRVTVINGSFEKASEVIKEKADIVFANLPYMKATSGFKNESEKKLFARHEMSGDVYSALTEAGKLLSDKGEFYAVYRIDRLADMIEAMKKAKIEPKNIVFVAGKEGDAPKLFLIRGVKGAQSGLRTRKIFTVDTLTGEKSAECEKLYEEGVLEWQDE